MKKLLLIKKHVDVDKKITDLTKNVKQISEKEYHFLLRRM